MTSIPWSFVDNTSVATRERGPPLFQMPHMWQPNLNMPNPRHTSHCDRAKLGWRKWAHEQPDMYAHHAEATVPDWYCRRVNNINHNNIKDKMRAYEQTSKPTIKTTYNLPRSHTEPRPVQQGYQATPHDIKGQIRPPQWGLSHPPHYIDPNRVGPLPPIHPDAKHL